MEQTEQSVRRFVGEVAPGEAVLSVLGQADYIDTPEWGIDSGLELVSRGRYS